MAIDTETRRPETKDVEEILTSKIGRPGRRI